MSNVAKKSVCVDSEKEIDSLIGDDSGFEEIRTTLVSRNITVFNRRTSIRLEPEMWKALKEIATRENCTIHDVCTLISLRKREKTSLTAGIRVVYDVVLQGCGHRRWA